MIVHSPVKKSRPNKNPILDLMRDGDMADPWGTATAWGFACAENLAAIGAEVPTELGYGMSPMGPVIESYEDFRVQEYLDLVNVDVWTADDAARVSEVQFAARCIARYLNWCKAAGRDY